MLSACVIAKNEEKLLPRLLKSLKGCSEIVVLDTGSTDGTKAAASRFPGVRVLDHKWEDDFAEARNAAASAAENSWILWLDADMYFGPGEVQRILSLLPQLPESIDSVGLKIHDVQSDTTFPSPRVYRRAKLHFTGRTHEDLGAKATCTTPFVVHHDRPDETPEQRAAKDARHVALLEAELAADPKSVHALTYLRIAAWTAGDIAAVERHCHALIEVQPDDYLSWHYLGQVFLKKGDYRSAVNYALNAASHCSTDPRVYLTVAEGFDGLGLKHEALTWARFARSIPDEAKLVGSKYAVAADDWKVVPLCMEGKIYADLGKRDVAMRAYKDALFENQFTSHKAAIKANLEALRK